MLASRGNLTRRFKCIAGIVCCGFLGGCDQAAMLKKATPPEAESAARSYVELLRHRYFNEIARDLDPSVTDGNLRETLGKMADLFPEDPDEFPQSIKVVGVNVSRAPEFSTTTITLEYQLPKKWLLVNIATRRKGSVATLTAFQVNAIPDSLENLNRFTFAGKSEEQRLQLDVAICCLLFSLNAFVICIRTKGVKLKWLWMLFILFGLGKFALNWTTGQWTVTPWAVQIPCMTASASLYGPWTISAALPLGAILFLNHRWKMKVTGKLLEPAAK